MNLLLRNILTLLLLLLFNHVQHHTVAETLSSASSSSVQNKSISDASDKNDFYNNLGALEPNIPGIPNSVFIRNGSSTNWNIPNMVSDNLIFAKSSNSSVISSLGSIDVVVPSLPGVPERPTREHIPRANLTGMIFPHIQKNKNTAQPDSPMLNHIFDTHSKHTHGADRFGGPRIDAVENSEISVDTDATAELECRVISLQDKMVSWARRKPGKDNIEILTIGQQTYTADSRFSAEFRQPETWRLLLERATHNDSGTYECQVSTHPPLISRIKLLVHRPTVMIVEGGGKEVRDRFYERNSTLKLACRVRHLASKTNEYVPTIIWLHAGRNLNDDTIRGGLSVKTEAVEGGADSTLLVARLNSSDSGIYTCTVAGLQAQINVHVLNESLAELHQGAGHTIRSPSLFTLLVFQSFTAILITPVILHLAPR